MEGYIMKLQNKKLILTLATVTLFTNSLFANMDEKRTQLPENMMIKHFYMKTMPMKPHHKFEDRIISKIMMLDLSKEQKKQIKEIVHTKNKKTLDPLDAFSEDGFDKEKFILAIENKKETKLKNKAEKIAKVYALLTKEQKKDLKTILDMEKLMKKKMSKKHKPEFRG